MFNGNIINSMIKYKELFQSGGLSLDRLRTLVAIADSGSMTRAADGSPSQMAQYSRQIKELEAFFKTKLADRRGRSLCLNTNGKRLVLIAREALENLSGFAGTCQNSPRELVIGAGNSMIEWWLMPRLEKVRAALPLTNITLMNTRTADAIEKLRDLTLDIGIVRQDAVTAPLKMEKLFSLRYVLFVPDKFARGVTPQNVAKKLAEIPLALSVGGQFREQLGLAAEKARVSLNIAIRCSSFTQAARAVAGGVAAAILPEIAEAEFRGATVKKFQFAFLSAYTRQLCIAWNPRREDSQSQLLKAVSVILGE